MNRKKWSKGGLEEGMYIWQACFEYLISILVTGSFLATLTKHLGISDSLTGILSSIISLGCVFQLFSLSIRTEKKKRFVLTFSIINQLLFLLLYAIPLIPMGKGIKVMLFVVFIVLAYLVYNIAHPIKINWLMSSIEDSRRGRFTANKEIVSLVFGIVFSFAMGALVDHFAALGQMRTAFTLSAVVIFVLMVLHSLTMIVIAEKPLPQAPAQNPLRTLRELMRNKDIIRIIVIFLLYYVANYVSTPFLGTYQIGELGLNLKFVSGIAICGSVARICVSRFWGGYADRNSFAVMLEKCFIFKALAELFIVFAVPATGKVMLILYHICHGISMGGTNSALTNLIFDYVPVEQRTESLAVTQALAGLVGFFATLCTSPLVSAIQNNGNTLFGMPVYAQQIVNALAMLITLGAIVYMRRTFLKKKEA